MPYCNQCGTSYEMGNNICSKCNSALPISQEESTRKTITEDTSVPKTKRFIAGIIDLAVAFLLGYAFIFIKRRGMAAMLVKRTVPIILPHVYLLLKDSFEGKSVGKLFMNIIVYNEKGHKPAGVLDSIIRNWFFAVPGIGPTLFSVVVGAQILLGNRKRLGEDWAKTVVISDEDYSRLK